MKKILEAAKGMQDRLVEYRRHIHANAELGMETKNTAAFVIEKLTAMGYEPELIAGNGVVALVGGENNGKTVLLRADMDALPMLEETDIDYKCEAGAMHACGHDFHTAMLLGAAEILKDMEGELEGTVKLMFQPGEEVLAGAKAMMDAGVLKNPDVDSAMMIHVMTGAPVPEGSLMLAPSEGPLMAAADWYEIRISGKGGHGAMPEHTVDPLNIAAHTHIALQAINAREAVRTEPLSMTIGVMEGGSINNVIPDKARLAGTIRTFSEQTRDLVHRRIREIAEGTARTFGGTAEVEITKGVPALVVDGHVQERVKNAAVEVFGPEKVIDISAMMPGGKVMGSEDFAFISHEVPSMMIALAAGDSTKGYTYSIHHPKVRFDESVLSVGAASYVISALVMLADQ